MVVLLLQLTLLKTATRILNLKISLDLGWGEAGCKFLVACSFGVYSTNKEQNCTAVHHRSKVHCDVLNVITWGWGEVSMGVHTFLF